MSDEFPIFGEELDWWQAWRAESGEPVPDFNQFPSRPFLPSLLATADGAAIETPEAWARQRPRLWQQLCRWMLGSLPPENPRLAASQVRLEEATYGTLLQRVELTFTAGAAGDSRVSIDMDIIRPRHLEHGDRVPLFLTQTTHRGWATIAASRGYMACIIPACDDDDQSQRFASAYPDADWTTIPRRAWLVGRVLDYLLGLPEVAVDQVGITGHSRNGKLSVIAAAMDPRITAVIASSAGTVGTTPWRLVSEAHYGESIEVLTRAKPDWFHPRLRFFVGREDRLPIDVHALLGLIAPRHCLISGALNDHCESVFATERAYEAAREVYRLLGAEANLRIRWRPGGHEAVTEDIQAYLDWLDHAFGRGPSPLSPSQRLYTAVDLDSSGVSPPGRLGWPAGRQTVKDAVRWSLGRRPPLQLGWGANWDLEKGAVETLMRREHHRTPGGVAKMPVQFGEHLTGDLYHPAKPGGPLPLVIWLHPFHSTMGYLGRQPGGQLPVYHFLAQAGFAVFAFDQLGFGRRIQAGAAFYQRYPQWSKLDKMVRDVQAVIDVLTAGHQHWPEHEGWPSPTLPPLDTGSIFLLGYSLGAWVGLYTAALDERVAGLAAFSSLSPLRSRHSGKETDACRRLSRWHGLLPRLALFTGREADVPYDLEHLLSLLAPRPCLVVSPSHDRYVDQSAMADTMDRAARAYASAGAAAALRHERPVDYNRFHQPQHQRALDWLKAVSPPAQR